MHFPACRITKLNRSEAKGVIAFFFGWPKPTTCGLFLSPGLELADNFLLLKADVAESKSTK